MSLGQNLTLRGPSCDTLDSLKGREPALKGFPIPHTQLPASLLSSQYMEADVVVFLGRGPPELVAEPGTTIHGFEDMKEARFREVTRAPEARQGLQVGVLAESLESHCRRL